MRQIWPETGESLVIFFKILFQLYLFCFFSIFVLMCPRGYQRQYFWTINLKLFAYAYEATTEQNRGIPCKILR